MERQSIRARKKRLASYLMNWPFLRVLLFDPWFRVAFVGFLGLLLLLAIGLPKIWRTTPKGFKPEVRISLLDRAQAWSLQRSARKLAAASNDEGAEFAWHASIANHPAHLGHLRSYVEFCLQTPGDRDARLKAAVGYVGWLLRLSGTNKMDLLLAVRVFDRLRYDRELIELVRGQSVDEDTEIPSAWLRALFHSRAMDDFRRGIETLRARGRLDADMELYEAAYQAGWGSGELRAAGRQRLEEAADRSPAPVLPHRLLLAVSAQNGDLARYERSLKALAALGADTLSEHAMLWGLLAAEGRAEEARERLRNYDVEPTTASEAVLTAGTMRMLGMREEELAFWRRQSTRLGGAPAVWIAFGDLLIEMRRWSDLRVMAAQLRESGTSADVLRGYSYFLEGRAEYADGRWQSAEDAFAQAGQLGSSDPRMALDVARRLVMLHQADHAMPILLSLETRMGDQPDYWQVRFGAHAQQRDWRGMLASAERGYAINPKDLSSINNMAAMWLVTRQKPEEALKLTLELVLARPDATASRINRSLALTRNHRVAESEEMLKSIVPQKLSAEELNAYHMAWMEYYHARGDLESARGQLRRVDARLLLEPQLDWIRSVFGETPG